MAVGLPQTLLPPTHTCTPGKAFAEARANVSCRNSPTRGKRGEGWEFKLLPRGKNHILLYVRNLKLLALFFKIC